MKFFIPFSLLATCNALNQLSFSGGGSFGAVEIGIIHKIRDTYKTNYDVYTGISAGGINAAFLSHFKNIDEGIVQASSMYNNMKNHDVYSVLPSTHVSILNSFPLNQTMTYTIQELDNPSIPTFIGTTNLYSGDLDIFRYDYLDNINDMVSLLMCTSAIPIVFPPIYFKQSQYADGGTLQNQLLNILHNDDYINITYITPFRDNINDDTFIDSLSHYAKRTFQVIKHSYNNEFNKINQECDEYIGEIHRYFIDNTILQNYDMLNFNHGELFYEAGYNYTQHEMIYFC